MLSCQVQYWDTVKLTYSKSINQKPNLTVFILDKYRYDRNVMYIANNYHKPSFKKLSHPHHDAKLTYSRLIKPKD